MMGMFDQVDPGEVVDCPSCSAELRDWQSKDGPCTLDRLPLSTDIDTFYTSCRQCELWVEFRAKPSPPQPRTLADYQLRTNRAEPERTHEYPVDIRMPAMMQAIRVETHRDGRLSLRERLRRAWLRLTGQELPGYLQSKLRDHQAGICRGERVCVFCARESLIALREVAQRAADALQVERDSLEESCGADDPAAAGPLAAWDELIRDLRDGSTQVDSPQTGNLPREQDIYSRACTWLGRAILVALILALASLLGWAGWGELLFAIATGGLQR